MRVGGPRHDPNGLKCGSAIIIPFMAGELQGSFLVSRRSRLGSLSIGRNP